MGRNARVVLAIAFLLGLVARANAASDPARVRAAALAGNFDAIRPMGPEALPELVRLYSSLSDARQRATVAYVFYNLGWKSPEAKQALMADVHTQDQTLRVQVQWALGRVSDDPDVVDVLLDNMRHDGNALFRDKAACALAYDQIHLAPVQKLRLFAGLILALDDENPQVRQIAIQALEVLTKQTKGFQAGADKETRTHAVEAWRRWLVELRSQL